MRVAPLAIHNRYLELYEARCAASREWVSARGYERRKWRKKCEALDAELEAINASRETWPESRAEMSYGVPAPCGTRISHYMSKIDGAWVRHE
jgi:hypothetical protein